MPILIDRRKFLMAAGAAAVTMSGRAQASDSVRWALLSDTHCPEDVNDTFRGFKPYANLVTAVGQVSAKAFDAYLVNGDLARKFGHEGDYRKFSSAIQPLAEKSALALSLGNHDDRKNAMAAFAKTAGDKEPVNDKWVSVIETGALRFVLLDSLYQTNISAGLLGKAQRDWLDGYLRAHADRPTIVFVHHTLDDADGSMLDSDRFLNIVTPIRHVKAVMYGHSHVYKYDVREGMHLVNLPAVGYNFADDQPVGWVEAELNAKGAKLQLHAFGGNRAQDGQTRAIEWR